MSKVIYTFIIEVEDKTSTSKKFKNFILNFISELPRFTMWSKTSKDGIKLINLVNVRVVIEHEKIDTKMSKEEFKNYIEDGKT